MFAKIRGFKIVHMYWEGGQQKDFSFFFSIFSEIRGILYYPTNECAMSQFH
jgi:hypothetical protein